MSLPRARFIALTLFLTAAAPCSSTSTPPGMASVDGGTPASPRETACADAVDNDGNGLTDCDDPACAADPLCDVPELCPRNDPNCDETPVEICDNAVDDDDDTRVDCDDPDCTNTPACSPQTCPGPQDEVEAFFGVVTPSLAHRICLYDSCGRSLGGQPVDPPAADPGSRTAGFIVNPVAVPVEGPVKLAAFRAFGFDDDAGCPEDTFPASARLDLELPAVASDRGRPIVLLGGAPLNPDGTTRDICGPTRDQPCTETAPGFSVFYSECAPDADRATARVINLSPNAGPITVEVIDDFSDPEVTVTTFGPVPYGAATDYVALSKLPADSSFPLVEATLRVKNASNEVIATRVPFGPAFPDSGSRMMWTGFCYSILFTGEVRSFDGAPIADPPALFVEDAPLCEVWRSSDPSGEPAHWPMCE